MQAISIILKYGPSPIFVALPEIAFKEAFFATAILWAIAKTRKDNVENTKPLSLKDFSTLGVGLSAAIITQPIDKIAELKQCSEETLSTADAFKQIITKNYCPLDFFKGLSRRIVLFTGSIFAISYIQNESYLALERSKW